MSIRIYEQKTTDQRHDLKEFLFTSFAQLLHIVPACCEKILKSNQYIQEYLENQNIQLLHIVAAYYEEISKPN